MASSYTANNGIEKIGTGEQAGTWGATTNTNFDILDRAINGVGAITLSGTTHTLTTTDGTLSDGHFKVLVFGGTLSSTNTVTISPNDQDKLYFVFNNTSGSQSIIVKQGSGATVTVANGKTAIVYADGAGSGAAVAQIETGSDAFTEDLTIKTSAGGKLTLQTSDTSVTDGDVLGALQFQAPNESGGTDSTTVSAAIVAEADSAFDAATNETDMVFKLGSSGVAAEKMRLYHEGHLQLALDSVNLQFGSDSDTFLTHVHNVGLLLNSTRRLYFEDGSNLDQYIGSGGSGVLEIASPTEIDITATTIDMNGNLDVSGSITLGGTAITSTAAELNILDGVTATATELNIIDGVTATTAELNILDGVTATASEINILDGVTSTASELNILDGVTASTAEINILDGVTSSTAELNILDGVTSSTAELNILDGVTATASELNIMDGVTATTAELNILDGVTSTASELNLVDGITAGTVSASKAVIVDSNKDITGFRNIANTGTITASGDITAFSDERLKSDIQTIDNALYKVMNMRGVSYTKQAEKGIGVIAQEVEKVLPEVVTDGEFKSVAYGNIVGVLIEAIKDLKKELDDHKQECTCDSSE